MEDEETVLKRTRTLLQETGCFPRDKLVVFGMKGTICDELLNAEALLVIATSRPQSE